MKKIDWKKVNDIIQMSDNNWINAAFAIFVIILIILGGIIIGSILVAGYAKVLFTVLCIVSVIVLYKGVRGLIKEYNNGDD